MLLDDMFPNMLAQEMRQSRPPMMMVAVRMMMLMFFVKNKIVIIRLNEFVFRDFKKY